MTQSELDADDVALQSSFVAKQFRLFSTEDNTDSWSLFSFKFKFVLRRKRDYQFATDSLKIDILSYFQKKHDVPITSSFGDIPKIIELLRRRQIDGGGLLKYCLLKYKGFKDARENQELQDLKDRTKPLSFGKCSIDKSINHYYNLFIANGQKNHIQRDT
ncbi:unnamed protein product [Caenorhabditis brenneri]